MRVGVIFGGQSAEHEVSVRSARSVIEHLDPHKYEALPIGIDKGGSWLFLDKKTFFLSTERGHLPTLKGDNNTPPPSIFSRVAATTSPFSPCALREILDLMFPLIHGPNGEDGTIQGLMQLINLPYVGSNVLSSAICMDKIIMKKILRGANLPIPRYLAFHCGDAIDADRVIAALKLPLFVKPANLGSSVGVNKIHTRGEFDRFVHRAFLYDEYILIEECIDGREFECAVLGNRDPLISLPGEIVPSHEFYSYAAKYLDADGAQFILPAQLDPLKIKEIQDLGLQAFRALRCGGMARVDFFQKKNGEIVINELNTIPGFTTTSLYAKLLEISGISYSTLLDSLIRLSIERFSKERACRAAQCDALQPTTNRCWNCCGSAAETPLC